MPDATFEETVLVRADETPSEESVPLKRREASSQQSRTSTYIAVACIAVLVALTMLGGMLNVGDHLMGAHPVLFDEKPGLTGEQMLAGVDEPGEVTVCAGTLPENIAHALDLIVMSPGVPVDLPRVRAWKEAGLPVIGEVELAYRAGHGRVLAVTGTNGKTTTTSLLGDIMRAAVPEVFVVGNIGNAYTGAALRTTERSTVVAEISSFQLETM